MPTQAADPRPALARLAPAQTAVVSVATVTAAGVRLSLPAAIAHVVDQVATVPRSYGLALAVLALLGVRLLTEVAGALAQLVVTTRVTAALRERMTRHVFTLGVPGTRHLLTGDLVARLTGDAAAAGSLVSTRVDAAVAAVTSLGGLAGLWLVDWRLGAAFACMVVPVLLLLRLLMRRVTTSYGEYLERQADIAARLTDALSGSRTIRASGTAEREIRRVLAALPELTRAGMATWEAQRRTSWQVDLALAGLRVVVLIVAGLGVADGRVSPGEFLEIGLYLSYALGFLDGVDTLVYLADARANADRVFDVLAERPRPRPRHIVAAGAEGLPPGPGALSFRQVSVRLGDRVVLDAVDLDIPAGTGVALVGRSGAGKTTLAMLAGRLVDPDDGEVLLDGVRVDAIEGPALRREVAYAFDRPVLLGRTVRDALTYGRVDASDEEIEKAITVARAEGFVRLLPDGVDTPLAATHLSGGELQRLGLARAVAHGGRVLVLDDATSSLDTVTEAQVTRALTDGLAGRTRLVVAHRAATAARADLVAWLDGGRIRAIGPHARLWASEPDYRAVFAAVSRPDEECV
ncbi:ABC transporter ATP-binding protein [Microtetraspora glauca]|uniref:ABC transporter ATP-binding protein n=1 Tax=Microtetraspora glauca TaxID=1996 RepID=A0ABV3GF39_MICGL